MSNATRFKLNLTFLALVVMSWIGGIVATFMVACQPGQGGALVFTMLVGCIGYGFVHEALTHTRESLYHHPIPRTYGRR